MSHPSSANELSIECHPIGEMITPFTQKFGIPRQSSGLTAIPGYIKLFPPYDDINGFRGIDDFSHLWIVFQFNQHTHTTQTYSPLIRPPRLGGNEKIGVFASRSSFRPNNIGLSKVKYSHIERIDGETRLHILGVDCLSGTPVLDIKPYVTYADNQPDAQSGFADVAPPQSLTVTVADNILTQLEQCIMPDTYTTASLLALIEQVIAFDPRPAYHQKPDYQAQNPNKTYHIRLFHLDITFIIENNKHAHIINIQA
jgi:tRNA-Thr(GGU) m(6)t(6)A37 methyltransferase TsaA